MTNTQSFVSGARESMVLTNRNAQKYYEMQENNEVVDYAEICVIGRSNVGKSSLLNSVCGSKVAVTSKTPGKTSSLNFILLPEIETILVDTPGYGFANKPGKEKNKWKKLMMDYLNKSKE